MKKYIPTTLLATLTLLVPTLLFAQGYTSLVGLPGIGTNTTNFDAYIETIYAITITVAALLAVVKIVIAGVKWMTTDIVTSKGDAKKDIQGAVVGLLVVLSAVLVIEIINPDINDVNLAINNTPPPSGTPSGSPTGSAAPGEPYGAILITQPGYTALTLDDATDGQRNQFRDDCVAGPGTYVPLSPLTGETRCNNPLSATTNTNLTNALTTGSAPLNASEQANVVDQYNRFLSPHEISDASTLASLAAISGVADVYFAIDTSTMPLFERGQIEGVCNTIARAQGSNPDIQTVFTTTADDGFPANTAVCLRAS